MIDESHFNGLNVRDLIPIIRCTTCHEEFKPKKSYYHRCTTCQNIITEVQNARHYAQYERSDFDEYDYEIDGYDLNVDWHK